MNKFQKFFLDGEACIQLYGLCSTLEELGNLQWLLEQVRDNRLGRGFAAEVKAMLADIEKAQDEAADNEDYADPESAAWTRDEAFSLFETIAQEKGCVFMLHPDLPGEAFLMTEEYYKEAFE